MECVFLTQTYSTGFRLRYFGLRHREIRYVIAMGFGDSAAAIVRISLETHYADRRCHNQTNTVDTFTSFKISNFILQGTCICWVMLVSYHKDPACFMLGRKAKA
jgi:hypothetical protein